MTVYTRIRLISRTGKRNDGAETNNPRSGLSSQTHYQAIRPPGERGGSVQSRNRFGQLVVHALKGQIVQKLPTP